jgi:HAD superfamily hydrolase (TIGR01548 family)
MPSQANFVLARFSRAPWVHRALISLGVAVRAFPGHDRLREHLRITVPGDDDSLARLARALRTVLAPEALLFDLDGVLADVSGSYREAILATAHSFGVDLTAGDVARAKQGGGANNDWQLTRRLMAERGVARSLDEVTTRFEGLYQGSDGRPGLRRHEQLLVDPGLLTELADRIPLAIVTGRPRRDAERFLDQHGVTACLGALVALEDAPSKPDPRPVRLALDRLGVEHAWMVGDTPDDVRAAGGAGVLPIGVVAPGDDPKGASESLSAAGAAMVLDRVTEIEEVMP